MIWLPIKRSNILYFSLFKDEDEFFNKERDKIEKYDEFNCFFVLWKHYEFEIPYQFKTYQILLYVLCLPLVQVAKEF
jgi:hypothetical protein